MSVMMPVNMSRRVSRLRVPQRHPVCATAPESTAYCVRTADHRLSASIRRDRRCWPAAPASSAARMRGRDLALGAGLVVDVHVDRLAGHERVRLRRRGGSRSSSVNEVVPSRLVRTEISSTSSKRAGAFHSTSWRTVWLSNVPSKASVGPRQRGAQELEAGEIDVVAVAGVEHHVLGVAFLVAHAQVVAERLRHGGASRSRRPTRAVAAQAVGADGAVVGECATCGRPRTSRRRGRRSAWRPPGAERLGAADDHGLVDQPGVAGTSAPTVGPAFHQQRVMPSSRRLRRTAAKIEPARSRRAAHAADGDAGGIARCRVPSTAAEDRHRHLVRRAQRASSSAACGSAASSTMRRGERSARPGSRQVSSGSSSTTVLRPTRMASARARRRCA